MSPLEQMDALDELSPFALVLVVEEGECEVDAAAGVVGDDAVVVDEDDVVDDAGSSL